MKWCFRQEPKLARSWAQSKLSLGIIFSWWINARVDQIGIENSNSDTDHSWKHFDQSTAIIAGGAAAISLLHMLIYLSMMRQSPHFFRKTVPGKIQMYGIALRRCLVDSNKYSEAWLYELYCGQMN
mmetsp:Transcript_286/g.672  ORF Transcript_286/g.672 Transcript_286/m.672 type:complete len:126 (+) Transcript_286:500-877(+)